MLTTSLRSPKYAEPCSWLFSNFHKSNSARGMRAHLPLPPTSLIRHRSQDIPSVVRPGFEGKTVESVRDASNMVRNHCLCFRATIEFSENRSECYRLNGHDECALVMRPAHPETTAAVSVGIRLARVQRGPSTWRRRTLFPHRFSDRRLSCGTSLAVAISFSGRLERWAQKSIFSELAHPLVSQT